MFSLMLNSWFPPWYHFISKTKNTCMFFIFMKHTYVVLVRGTLIPLNKRCYICLHFCCKGKHLYIIFPKKSYILYIVFFFFLTIMLCIVYLFITTKGKTQKEYVAYQSMTFFFCWWDGLYISVASRWKVELL